MWASTESRERRSDMEKQPVKRLAIVQESGIQLYCGRYETHIREFVPCDDEEFGKQWVAKLNRVAELPFYLVEVEVKIVGPMQCWSDDNLIAAGISPLED